MIGDIADSLCRAACVEVDSDTEAVAGHGFKLGCISCKMRGEVSASATVDWFFKAKGESDFVQIYSYEDETATIMDERFDDRLYWNGSKKTTDLQDGSIFILNVTFNDTGVYRCFFERILTYNDYEFHTNATKFIHINVVAKATRGMASILSEVMMYVSIIGLQLWLVVEMVYCYRKIAAAGEEALRESAAPLPPLPKTAVCCFSLPCPPGAVALASTQALGALGCLGDTGLPRCYHRHFGLEQRL
uniref:Sodium channel regulatory subunit beta-1 n=1 Tax=Paramormyrops kingsleyae TaxID=1676925 RepID=A0A3B3SDQ5_9TELE